MKTFLSFAADSFGFFYAPKRTFEDLREYYKPSLLTLGLIVSLLARAAYSVGKGVQNGWHVSTVFFDLAAGYLGAFMGISLILSLTALFDDERIPSKEFWGLYFASDLPMALVLPIALAGTLTPFSLEVLILLVGIWSFLLKLFLIQKTLHTNFAKALILFMAPALMLFLWIVTNSVVLIDIVSKTFRL